MEPRALGLAGGILWGLAIFIMTWIGYFTSYAGLFLSLMVDIYPGYSVSLLGSFIGLAYGFVDGFCGLYVLAWLYNYFE